MGSAAWWVSLDQLALALARILLALLWQSSILLVSVSLLAFVVRRQGSLFKRNVWLGALLVIPCLPLLSGVASELGAPKVSVWTLPSYPVLPPADSFSLPRDRGFPEESAATVSASARLRSNAAFPVLSYLWLLIGLGYISGAGGLLASVVRGILRLRRWRRQAATVTNQRVLDAFRTACKQLGVDRDVEVLESASAQDPMTVGILRPAILLPRGYAERLAAVELHAVAAHEVAHIRSHDPALLAVVSLIRAALFLQPLVWLAGRQLSLLTEHACDEAALGVTGDRVSYAKLLHQLAQRAARRVSPATLPAAFVVAKSSLVVRVERILSYSPLRIRGPSRAALTSVVAGGALSLALALSFSPKESGAVGAWHTMVSEALGARARGEAEQALLLCQRALSSASADEDRADVLLQMAETYQSQGRLSEAVATYQGILRDYPQTGHRARIRFRLGELYASVSLLPEGATEGEVDRLQRTEMIPEKGEIPYFEQAVVAGPPLSSWVLASKLYLARLYMDTGRQAQAWSILQELATLKVEEVNTPDYVGPYAELSTQKTAEERVAEARAFAARVRRSAQTRLVSWSVVK
jgi:beta-lactamase regulating signal transducer with metallopeptidase domain